MRGKSPTTSHQWPIPESRLPTKKMDGICEHCPLAAMVSIRVPLNYTFTQRARRHRIVNTCSTCFSGVSRTSWWSPSNNWWSLAFQWTHARDIRGRSGCLHEKQKTLGLALDAVWSRCFTFHPLCWLVHHKSPSIQCSRWSVKQYQKKIMHHIMHLRTKSYNRGENSLERSAVRSKHTTKYVAYFVRSLSTYSIVDPYMGKKPSCTQTLREDWVGGVADLGPVPQSPISLILD